MESLAAHCKDLTTILKEMGVSCQDLGRGVTECDLVLNDLIDYWL